MAVVDAQKGIKSTKRQFLVSIEGITGNWRISSGGGISAEVTKDYSGGSSKPDLLGGLPQADDLELTRTYEPFRDIGIIAKMRANVGKKTYTITKQATNTNFDVYKGGVTTYTGLLLSVSEPDSDAASSDAAEFTVKFATNGAQ